MADILDPVAKYYVELVAQHEQELLQRAPTAAVPRATRPSPSELVADRLARQSDPEEQKLRDKELQELAARFSGWVIRHRLTAPSTGKSRINIRNPLPVRGWALLFDRYSMTEPRSSNPRRTLDDSGIITNYSYRGLLICERGRFYVPDSLYGLAERSLLETVGLPTRFARATKWRAVQSLDGLGSAEYIERTARMMAEIALRRKLPIP